MLQLLSYRDLNKFCIQYNFLSFFLFSPWVYLCKGSVGRRFSLNMRQKVFYRGYWVLSICKTFSLVVSNIHEITKSRWTNNQSYRGEPTWTRSTFCRLASEPEEASGACVCPLTAAGLRGERWKKSSPTVGYEVLLVFALINICYVWTLI